jgi:DDE domain
VCLSRLCRGQTRACFERAFDLHDVPDSITIDKSGANTAAIQGLIIDPGADIEPRHSKYLNNIVEQGLRAIKRIVRPMLRFKSFLCATIFIAGIEVMHMIKKHQLVGFKNQVAVSGRAVLLFGILISRQLATLFGFSLLMRQNCCCRIAASMPRPDNVLVALAA